MSELSDAEIKEYVRRGLITNYATLDQVQQSGFDLRVHAFYKAKGKGFIGISERRFPEKIRIEPADGIFGLESGAYDVEFIEGCNFPDNISAQILPRSSSIKCVAPTISGIYDQGYKAEHIVALLMVLNPEGLGVEQGASIAKIKFEKTSPVIKTYDKKIEKSNNGKIETGGHVAKNRVQFTFSDF